MSFQRAQKPWPLSKNETINSFEVWRENLTYLLGLDTNFAPYLLSDVSWSKKSSDSPHRGFVDDLESVPEPSRKSAAQKVVQLELMLGQIANFCPVITRNTIVKNSTSLNYIWQQIREHYGFQSSGSHILDLSDIKLEPGESPQSLYQRLLAFFEDNLLCTAGGIYHDGEIPKKDEELSPTLQNTIVWLWLQLVNPNLPSLVKQKYGAELRNKTLFSLKSEISQSVPSLLSELHAIEDSKVLRSVVSNQSRPRFQNPIHKAPSNTKQSVKTCTLCKAAGRPYSSHYLSACAFLPDSDRRAIARSRLVQDDEGDTDIAQSTDDFMNLDLDDSALLDNPPSARRVNITQSPHFDVFYANHPIRLTIDTGATTNMIRASAATNMGFPVIPASQMARQADGVTPLEVVGEVHVEFTRGSHSFQWDALVVNQLDVDFLAGNTFLTSNDIAVRPAKNQIVIRGSEIVYYRSQRGNSASVRRTQAYVCRGPGAHTVLLPGDYVEVTLPNEATPDSEWALEPRYDAPCAQISSPSVWPHHQEIKSVGHAVRLTNDTADPVIIRRHEHFCQVRPVVSFDPSSPVDSDCDITTHTVSANQTVKQSVSHSYSDAVTVDPNNILPHDMVDKFVAVNRKFDNVFNPSIGKYNGRVEGTVNMGPVLPPQRKGRLPSYNHARLLELQNKFDVLEEQGVFAKPEDVNVSVEYLNMSFLVNKANGGTRLVTSFGEVGQYSKPQPSIMPDVDSTLRAIGRWKYIIKTDLSQSFYQIPLSHSSMKYCGVATPFKGVRVYTRCAMGMPGSETALEEIMNRVIGHLIAEGTVAKIADDLYCGGDTPEQALTVWERILQALRDNNLHLSAPKTVICPRSTIVLGWVWSLGTLSASSHRISALTTTEPPKSVQALRSFIGAYKVLSRVLKGYAQLLHPLEKCAAGKSSKEHIDWSEDLLQAFSKAQSALSSHKTITIPRPSDVLWIVTDGAVKPAGIGATLYILRGEKLLLAGFFNAQIKKNQITWLPCEVEALCISAAIKHFAPFIIQSSHSTMVLTDSRPCVLAYQKLIRGQFSASARVSTFLSNVSRYQIKVGHIAGVANLPSDYASRHPIACTDNSCQICKFIAESEEATVHAISVQDVCDGRAVMPFTNRTAWHVTQMECPNLRRTHSHLQQGTRPSKKMTNIRDVKRYLQHVVISRDGVLVVRDDQPFQNPRERIVVPRGVIDGLLAALHIRFNHPSEYQLKRLAARYFYALDMDKAVQLTTKSCHHCMALKSVPSHLHAQSTSPAPTCIGVSYAMDVMRRNRQCILVVRETVTSYVWTTFVDSEKHTDLLEGIVVLCADARPLGDTPIYIRVDPAPGFVALENDPTLARLNISLVIGNAKNKNKNPVAEHSMKELGLEMLHLSPEGGPISKMTLALASANMNSRIRRDGLSSRELWTQRDQITCEQLPVEDRLLLQNQQRARAANHPYSAKSKVHGKLQTPGHAVISVGDLVYLADDRDKTRARDKYLVVSVDDSQCSLRKFTRSQFRSRTYDVPMCECYPVLSNTLSVTPSDHIRGLNDSSDTDSDSDNVNTIPSPVTHVGSCDPSNTVTATGSYRSNTSPRAVDSYVGVPPVNHPLKSQNCQQSPRVQVDHGLPIQSIVQIPTLHTAGYQSTMQDPLSHSPSLITDAPAAIVSPLSNQLHTPDVMSSSSVRDPDTRHKFNHMSDVDERDPDTPHHMPDRSSYAAPSEHLSSHKGPPHQLEHASGMDWDPGALSDNMHLPIESHHTSPDTSLRRSSRSSKGRLPDRLSADEWDLSRRVHVSNVKA